MKRSLVELSEKLNVNILVVKGWGFADVADDEHGNFKIIETAPFDKLFPRVSAVVHHGGIGTLSLCLRAGVPSFSCPVIFPLGDQYFWGHHAYKIGCGVKPVPIKKLNVRRLTDGITEMLATESLRDKCKNMASRLASENGLENACRVIESQFKLRNENS
jgi:sterol 3beta-glucosyltransferase